MKNMIFCDSSLLLQDRILQIFTMKKTYRSLQTVERYFDTLPFRVKTSSNKFVRSEKSCPCSTQKHFSKTFSRIFFSFSGENIDFGNIWDNEIRAKILFLKSIFEKYAIRSLFVFTTENFRSLKVRKAIWVVYSYFLKSQSGRYLQKAAHFTG